MLLRGTPKCKYLTYANRKMYFPTTSNDDNLNPVQMLVLLVVSHSFVPFVHVPISFQPWFFHSFQRPHWKFTIEEDTIICNREWRRKFQNNRKWPELTSFCSMPFLFQWFAVEEPPLVLQLLLIYVLQLPTCIYYVQRKCMKQSIKSIHFACKRWSYISNISYIHFLFHFLFVVPL